MTTQAPVEPATLPQTTLAPRRHVLDLDDFSRAEIESVLDTAASMREVLRRGIKKAPPLRGKVILTLFYEPSTRTRVSFEQAGKLLSADVINIAASGSSAEKGESLLNTALTLQAMHADVVVVRHAQAGAPYFMARNLSRTSVINAGDGRHAHPTQGLLDLLTMRDHLGDLEGRRVVIVGDVAHSRVARSNLFGLAAMGAEVILSGPPTLMPLEFHRAAGNARAARRPLRTRPRPRHRRSRRGDGAAPPIGAPGGRDAAERARVHAPLAGNRAAHAPSPTRARSSCTPARSTRASRSRHPSPTAWPPSSRSR